MVQRPDNITKGNKRVKIGTDVYVVNGYNVTIDCNIANGTTPITLSWLLNETEYESNNTTITITNAACGDVITCRADNSIGFDEESTTIHVECKSFHYIHSYIVQILCYCFAQIFDEPLNQIFGDSSKFSLPYSYGLCGTRHNFVNINFYPSNCFQCQFINIFLIKNCAI